MNPTFLFVPGAWHLKECGSLLIAELEALGYPAQAVQLLTVGTTKSMADDTVFLRAEIERLMAEGRDVIPVLHSYAGVPGSTAIRGLGKAGQNGQAGCVLGVVFLSAFVPNEGQTVEGLIGGTFPPFVDVDELSGFTRMKDVIPVFYPDVPEPLATETANSLLAHSLRSLRDAAGPSGFKDAAFDGRRAYILTSQDPSFPVEVQEGIVAGSGVEFEIIDMPSSHSPFLSRPRELAGVLRGLAEKWRCR